MTRMKKHFITIFTVTIILLTIAWTLNFQVTRASTTLVVPADYPTITSAINHASQGDTIVVKPGVYHENIEINKSLTLQGEDNKNTLIIGNGGPNKPAVLTLEAASIKVTGFTIESSNSSTPSQNALGINIQGDSCTISGNIIQNNYFGIFCALQSFTTITNNIIASSIKDGIRFYAGSKNNISNNSIIENAASGIALGGYSNTVSRNNFQNNYRGLGLGASYSLVFRNKIISNTESAIFLSGSKNIISANEVAQNKYGIYITTQGAAPRANEIYSNNFVNNLNNAYGNSSYLIETWDNTNQLGGNYWSDYQTKYPNAVKNVGSGIENTPYEINSNNSDSHPLISPFDTSNPGKAPAAISPVVVASDGIAASWTFDNVENGWVIPDVTGNNPAILASTVGNVSFVPEQVPGKFGEALSFNGSAYAFVPPSPSLETPRDVTIGVWVNLQEIKNVSYNNILVECLRTTAPLPARTLGIAINGEIPQNSSSPPTASIRGYVMTQNGVLNEIDTKEPIPFNQWVHVVFTRSLTSGMHIYVNGIEQEVQVSSGVANPTGTAVNQNELYIGHDSITQIDELQIKNIALSQVQPLRMQWWIWPILFLGIGSCLIGFTLFRKRSNRQPTKPKQKIANNSSYGGPDWTYP